MICKEHCTTACILMVERTNTLHGDMLMTLAWCKVEQSDQKELGWPAHRLPAWCMYVTIRDRHVLKQRQCPALAD